jgi:hypothetical protein
VAATIAVSSFILFDGAKQRYAIDTWQLEVA